MIINFYINYKTYYEKILNNYEILNYECPKCGSKHAWVRHATYERNVVLIENEELVDVKMKILRIKCTSCNSTHAILPRDIIPYSIYSVSCILKLISENYCDGNSVFCIAQKYDISFQLIYNFLNRFLFIIKECNNIFRILEIVRGIFIPAPKEIIKILNNKFEKNNFSKIYARFNNWPFLMKKFRNIYPIPIYINFVY